MVTSRTIVGKKNAMLELPKNECTQCPLCVEEMDLTDLSFMPCPCGYRVCLFCVQQIKLHCRNQCPGCRREYGTVPFEAGPAASNASSATAQHQDLVPSSSSQQHEASSAPSYSAHHSNNHNASSSSTSSHPSSHHNSNPVYCTSHSGPPPGPRAAAQARAGTVQQPPKPPPQPSSNSMHERLKRAAEHSSAARKEEAASSGASVGLPSGATWATQAISKQQHQHHVQQQQEMERQAQQTAPVVADETAWPSLADTVQPAPASSSSSSAQQHKEQQVAHKQQAQQQQQLQALRQTLAAQAQRQRELQVQREEQQQQLRHSLSASSNSIDRVLSSSSIEHMSQDPVVPPEQLGLQHGRILQPPFAPSPSLADHQVAHFNTTVHGLSRNVSVSLPVSASVEPYAEAVPLLASLSSNIKAGGMNSKDAAAQLVALLKQKEAQQGRMQSLLAAGRAPPGFSVPQQPSPAPLSSGPSPAPPASLGNPPNSNGCLTPLDSPVIPTPSIGRYQPIGKPIGPSQPASLPQQPQQQQAPQSNGNGVHHPTGSSQGSAHPAPYANGPGLGTYSMWSGLPGIDLTPTYSPLGSSMWSGLGSCALPGVDPAAPVVSSAFAQPPTQPHTTAASTSRPPPPGFGGPSYTPGLLDASAAAKAGAGAAPGYRPLGALPGEARYNPLNPLNFQSSFNTSPPSSVHQFSAYRPQLL